MHGPYFLGLWVFGVVTHHAAGEWFHATLTMSVNLPYHALALLQSSLEMGIICKGEQHICCLACNDQCWHTVQEEWLEASSRPA